MKEKADAIMNIVRGAIRPFLAITGWTLFLFLVWKLVNWFITKLEGTEIDNMAVVAIFAGIVSTFTTAIIAIVNQWLGGRTTKK